VTFDDQETSLAMITGELEKQGNSIKGKPVYLKRY